MNIEIRRLSPDLAEDYAHFFNVTPYNVKTDGSKCYCVTRCNANENCHFCIDYLRSFWPIEETRADIRIKPVFCFVIAPQMQRKGIATQLLEHVCLDAADDGFDFVEAYVDKISNETDDDFRGYLRMYEKSGFQKHAEREGRIVVRKALK